MTAKLGRALTIVAVVSAAAVLHAASAADKVLGPTLFAGWQTRNVTGPVVVREAGGAGWRMYYSGSATEQASDAAWDLWATGLATSRDGRRWAYADGYEPVLSGRRFLEGEVVEAGPRAASFDALEARVGSVLHVGPRWWMWYTGWDGEGRATGPGLVEKVHFRIGAAVSADGRRWTKQPGAAGAGSVLGLAGEPGESVLAVGSPAVIADGASFRMWHETYGGATWRIAHATSSDGVHWTTTGVVLEPGPAGAPDELGARHPVVLTLTSGYELWYQGRSRSRPAFHVMRARSADGRTWRKVEGEVTLHPDPPVGGDEEIQVGTVIARPAGGREVFFSKETAVPRAAAFGVVTSRTTSIYAESVRVPE
jgi:hypothetical protein